MVQYMTSIVSSNKDFAAKPGQHITGHLYDKIQDTIFRLMATDSVPKFSKTDKYLSHIRKFDGIEDSAQYRMSSSSNSNRH